MDRLHELIECIPRFTGMGLLDCGGGTLAVRTEKGIYVSSLQAAEELDWQLSVDDFILFPGEGDASLARAGRRPSHENRLHRSILQEFSQWQFTYHGHPPGLLGFCYAQQPLPLSTTHAKRLGLRGRTDVPVASDASKGPEHQTAHAMGLLKESFGGSACGAVLVAGDGPVVAAANLNKLLATSRLLEDVAVAQSHLLKS